MIAKRSSRPVYKSRSKCCFTNMHKSAFRLFKPRGTSIAAILTLFLALGVDNSAVAWSIGDLAGDLVGPSNSDVEALFSWKRRTLHRKGYHDRPYEIEDIELIAKIKNNSKYYLTSIEFKCDFFDGEGNRLKKDSSKMEGTAALRPDGTATWSTRMFYGYENFVDLIETASCALVGADGEK